MKTKLRAFSILAVLALFHPLQSLAQQTQQQPPWDWPGPWHMWGGGWGLRWIFPLMMLFIVIACVAMFLFGHRSGGEVQKAEYEDKKAAILSSGQR